MNEIVIDGRTRIVKKVITDKGLGYKKNCAHKMGENEAINTWTYKHVEFRRCIKNCGHWRRKIYYFDTDAELDDIIDLNMRR